MADKYDEEIAELLAVEDDKAFYEVVWDHWNEASPLFSCVSPKNAAHQLEDYDSHGSPAYCGCLTQIRGGDHFATVDEKKIDMRLTEAIRFDERLPQDEHGIRREHLPVFAEWQRRLDKELGRT